MVSVITQEMQIFMHEVVIMQLSKYLYKKSLAKQVIVLAVADMAIYVQTTFC